MNKILIGTVIIFILLGFFACIDYSRPVSTKGFSHDNQREALSTYAAVYQGNVSGDSVISSYAAVSGK